MLGGVFSTVIAALCVAGILAAIKSRWLYVIVPKLYLNTPISDGQIVSLTIHNAGLLAEEDVALNLRNYCKFELIATSKSTLNVNGKTLSIGKIARNESVSIFLLFEEKAFEASDIESIESKATNGKIVDSKDKAIAFWQSILAIPLFLAFLLVPLCFGTFVGAEMKVSLPKYIYDKFELSRSTKQLADYKEKLQEELGEGSLRGAIKRKTVNIKVDEVLRRGDILTISLILENKLKTPLFVSAYSKSAAGEGSLDFYDTRIEDFALAPSETRVTKLKVYMPEEVSAKIVHNTFIFKNLDGDTMYAAHMLEFK